jgi:glycerol-3-phosphate acyltransferase PlsX
MKIVVDGFGGDNAPVEVALGCCMALDENKSLEVIITGDETKIRNVLLQNNIQKPDRLTIFNASEVIENEDDPIVAIKNKKDSSLVVGLNLVANGQGDAFLSAGNTGALLTGATLIIKRIKGIKRAALAPIIPTEKGKAIIIDVGANAECKPDFFPQFAIMGSIYAKQILNIQNPRVGLINIGVEEKKGTETIVMAHQLLKADENIDFVGNIEARDVLKGNAEVLVSDGFTGNIVLKTIEGAAGTMMFFLKDVFMKNIFTKLATLVLKSGLKKFKNKLDHDEVGGAPFLGLNAPVLKTHGSSNRVAFKNSILFANTFCEKKVCDLIAKAVNDVEM